MKASHFTSNAHLAAAGLIMVVHAAAQNAAATRQRRRESESVVRLANAYRRTLRQNGQMKAALDAERGQRLYLEYLLQS